MAMVGSSSYELVRRVCSGKTDTKKLKRTGEMTDSWEIPEQMMRAGDEQLRVSRKPIEFVEGGSNSAIDVYRIMSSVESFEDVLNEVSNQGVRWGFILIEPLGPDGPTPSDENIPHITTLTPP